MYVGFKYKWQQGFGRLYEYSFKHTHMITKSAKKRYKILCFWKKHGLKATKDAFLVKRSILYYWDKLYRDGEKSIKALNPKSTRPHKVRERIINPKIITEIRRLRIEVCPNMGKDKVKILLDQFCKKEDLKALSASTIGRIIKERKICHHYKRVYHNGRIKQERRFKKNACLRVLRPENPVI